jgi:hypothetical protein
MAMQTDGDEKSRTPFSRRSFIFALISAVIVVDIALAVMVFRWW